MKNCFLKFLLLLLLGPEEEPLPPDKGGLQVLEGIQHQAVVVLDMLVAREAGSAVEYPGPCPWAEGGGQGHLVSTRLLHLQHGGEMF